MAYLAMDGSWKIAEKSGSVEKPKILVGVLGTQLSPNDKARIVVGAPASLYRSSSLLSEQYLSVWFREAGKVWLI